MGGPGGRRGGASSPPYPPVLVAGSHRLGVLPSQEQYQAVAASQFMRSCRTPWRSSGPARKKSLSPVLRAEHGIAQGQFDLYWQVLRSHLGGLIPLKRVVKRGRLIHESIPSWIKHKAIKTNQPHHGPSFIFRPPFVSPRQTASPPLDPRSSFLTCRLRQLS